MSYLLSLNIVTIVKQNLMKIIGTVSNSVIHGLLIYITVIEHEYLSF